MRSKTRRKQSDRGRKCDPSPQMWAGMIDYLPPIHATCVLQRDGERGFRVSGFGFMPHRPCSIETVSNKDISFVGSIV